MGQMMPSKKSPWNLDVRDIRLLQGVFWGQLASEKVPVTL